MGQSEPAPWLLGASGQIGVFVRRQASAEERALLPVSRSAGAPDRSGWLARDLWRDGAPIEAEVLLSTGPLDGLLAWLQRCPAPALRRVIATGSMSLAHKADSADPDERALAERLRRSEGELLERCARSGIACCVVRPTLIYGAGLDRSLTPLARRLARWRLCPIPFARGLRQPIHAQDLARLIWHLHDAPRLPERLSVGGAEALRFDTMIERVAASVSARVWRAPGLAGAVRWAMRWRMPGSQRLPATWQRLDQDQHLIANEWPLELAAPRGFLPDRQDFFPSPTRFDP